MRKSVMLLWTIHRWALWGLVWGINRERENKRQKKKPPKKQKKKDVPCWSALLCLVCYWEIKQEMYLVSKLRQRDRLGCRHHVTNSQMAGKIMIMSMMSKESKGSQCAAVALNTWIRKGVREKGVKMWQSSGKMVAKS